MPVVLFQMEDKLGYLNTVEAETKVERERLAKVDTCFIITLFMYRALILVLPDFGCLFVPPFAVLLQILSLRKLQMNRHK